MGKCVCCGRETSHSATVYIKTPGNSPVKRTKCFCGDCVKERSGGLSPLFSIWPFYPLRCSGRLYRTGRAVAACSPCSRPFGGKFSMDDASEALKHILVKRENSAGGQILSLREYRRSYGQERL